MDPSNTENMQDLADLGDEFDKAVQLDQEIPDVAPSELNTSDLVEESFGEKGEVDEVIPLFKSQKSTCECCIDWVDKKPFAEKEEQLNKAVRAKSKRAAYAINVRYEPHGSLEWKMHSIVIHSSRITSALKKIFEGYPASFDSVSELELRPNFVPFYHQWEKLCAFQQAEKDEKSREQLNLLIGILEKELKPKFERREMLEKTRVAEFYDLEALFVPGEILVKDSTGQLQAGILQECTLETSQFSPPSYNVTVKIIDWNGEKFGLATRTWSLPEFTGARKIQNLAMWPLKLHPDRERISEMLINRGRKFASLNGQHFKFYSGSAESNNSWSWMSSGKTKVHGRVIVDTEGYHSLSSNIVPDLESLTKASDKTLNGIGEPPAAASEQEKPALSFLAEEHYLAANYGIRGFDLESKAWYTLNVDSIQDIKWTAGIMEKLVLDQDEKDLLLGLLYKSSSDTEEIIFDDFIPGKGKGVIVLLCGPPGVGKTLTAEAVSEHLKRPLYRLCASDLGTDASTVETNLEIALARCTRWDALLLIDEADVFFENRSVDSMQRNEVVASFLRLLEYYAGILFLTTNRASTMDPAFESRIDITLAFSALSPSSRREIWENFLRAADMLDRLSEEELAKLAEANLNGRQIKSAMKTASILAASQGMPTSYGHLEKVIRIREKAAKALLGGG